MKELVHAATEQGWEVHVDGAGHYRMVPPGGDIVGISISATPSDHRTLKNEAAALKRMGLRLPGQKKKPNEPLCLASWHTEPDHPVGFCSHCRGCWKVDNEQDLTDVLMDATIQEFVVPDEWLRPATEGEEVTVDVDEGSIRSRVLKVLQDLKGEYLSTADVAAIAEIPREQVGTALRTLYAAGQVERSKRGRYGYKPQRQVPSETPPVETEPETAVEMAEPGPPDPSKPWRWLPGAGWEEDVRAEDAPPLYEGTGLKDGKGRPVIRDEAGDLYVAVPLVLSV